MIREPLTDKRLREILAGEGKESTIGEGKAMAHELLRWRPTVVKAQQLANATEKAADDDSTANLELVEDIETELFEAIAAGKAGLIPCGA